MNKIIIFMFIILTGCFFPSKYKDVSHEEKYVPLIGQKYKTDKILLIYGITADKNYRKQINYYAVFEPPGVGGPEIITEGRLEPGTIIQIKKALRRIGTLNCLDSRIAFELEILSETKYRDHPVMIRSYHLTPEKLGLEID